ncbi:MAG: type II secretion system F family protein [Planctomycetota bacterium]
MAVFSYSGSDTANQSVRGTVTADTARQARDTLRAQGVRVRKISVCKPKGETRSRFQLPFKLLPRGGTAWSSSVSELAMLLHAGIPMLDALDTISDQSRGAMRAALLTIRDRVAAGESFAQALRSRSDLFDEASIAMVEVGENAGNLEKVLGELADFKRRQSQFSDAVTTALVYPLFLVVFGAAAGIFLMTSVLPPLLENLEETLDELPWPTRVAKAISILLVDYRWPLVLGMAATGVLFAFLFRSTRGRAVCDRVILRVPVLGPMFIKQGVSRIAVVIATLSRSGVELTRAFELAERSTRNTVFRAALRECGQRIAAGQDVADAFGTDPVFPPLAVRIFSVGQESGKLDTMLLRLAEDYDEQVRTASTRLTSLIEPVLILVLALLVGFLLLATILPILEAGNVA